RELFDDGEPIAFKRALNFIGATITINPSLSEDGGYDITVTPVDVLSDEQPQGLGSTDAGNGSKAARDDHVHAHGNLAGGTLHALAVAGVSHGFISSTDQALLEEATATATPSAIVRRDVAGNIAVVDLAAVDIDATNITGVSVRGDVVAADNEVTTPLLRIWNGADDGLVVTYDAPVAAPAQGAQAWVSNGQTRSWDERGVRHEVTSQDAATGATSKGILDRIGRYSGNTTGNKAVLTILASQLPAGNFAARITVDWFAFDVTGSKAAGGALMATIRGIVDGVLTVSVMTTAANQQVKTADNDSTSIDTTTTLPQVIASSNNIVVQVTALNTNQVRISARVRDFFFVEH
ncbi:MAG: hypothetical protein HOW73_45480, partial [Polyangiaceae bacterium]|nr:hypothetical protein [Polyangiaceae bacterium]